MEKMKDNIILIGFMGCGKTTIGKMLSRKLSYRHVDIDHEIEKEAGCAIKDIFAEKGEDYFRDLETQTIKKLRDELSNTVISTGGGLPLKPQNADILKDMGLVVYLKASPDVLWNRLKYDKTRPLLQKPSPKQELLRLLEYRDPFYMSAAHLVIDEDDKGVEAVALEVMGHMEFFK